MVCDLPMKPIVLIPPAGQSDNRPYRSRVDPKPIQSSISPVVWPETHSKQASGLSLQQIMPSCFLQSLSLVLTTNFYLRSLRRNSAYSSLLTRQMGVIPFCWQSFINILEIYEAAAVTITDVALSYLIRSTIASAVRGFTKRAAPYSNEISSFKGMQLLTSVTMQSANAPPIL